MFYRTEKKENTFTKGVHVNQSVASDCVYYTAGNNECRAARIDQAVNKFIEGVNCLAEVLLTLTTFYVCVCVVKSKFKVWLRWCRLVLRLPANCQFVSLPRCSREVLSVCSLVGLLFIGARSGMANQVRT